MGFPWIFQLRSACHNTEKLLTTKQTTILRSHAITITITEITTRNILKPRQHRSAHIRSYIQDSSAVQYIFAHTSVYNARNGQAERLECAAKKHIPF